MVHVVNSFSEVKNRNIHTNMATSSVEIIDD